MPIRPNPERYTVRLALTVPAIDEGAVQRTIPYDAMLLSMQVYIPPGPEGQLRLWPFILLPGARRIGVLARDDAQASDEYISGEAYERTFVLNKRIPAGSILGVDYANSDPMWAHSFELTFDLDESLGVMV
jgi:hypothetical protein